MESQGLDEAQARDFARETGIRRTVVAQKNLQKDLAAKTKATQESEKGGCNLHGAGKHSKSGNKVKIFTAQ
jgi:hypothetical protein